MQLSDVFLQLGEDGFQQLLRSISVGKLKTYQLFDRFKVRTHLAKVNTEQVRKMGPRFWTRLQEHDEEFATDLSQAVLVSNLNMIVEVLNLLGIPHDDGFFAKDIDAAQYLKDGWEARVFEEFKGKYSESLLLFYINHLARELNRAQEPFVPAA